MAPSKSGAILIADVLPIGDSFLNHTEFDVGHITQEYRTTPRHKYHYAPAATSFDRKQQRETSPQ
jgi:hypothetical protein